MEVDKQKLVQDIKDLFPGFGITIVARDHQIIVDLDEAPPQIQSKFNHWLTGHLFLLNHPPAQRKWRSK